MQIEGRRADRVCSGLNGYVADSEHLAESTGSTSQLWSIDSGTQLLTISCGFPAPC